MKDGPIDFITGAYGYKDGSIKADYDMFLDDVDRFGDWPRVTIHNN